MPILKHDLTLTGHAEIGWWNSVGQNWNHVKVEMLPCADLLRLKGLEESVGVEFESCPCLNVILR